MMSLLIFLFGVSLVVFIITKLIRLNRKVNSQTFSHYQNQYPNLVKNGRVTCFACGGKSIHLQTIGSTPRSLWKAHTCRTCGTILYYSKSKM